MFNDRYEQVLGGPLVGGMAAVSICIDKVLERKVAIKNMPRSADRRRIHDELGALLKMRSKHVVQVYDLVKIGKDDLAIVEEFIEGPDLFDETFSPRTADEYLKLVWQIAAGIADIHSANIIHRDIKPNNMKIDPEGVVKIFDFGLARHEGPGAFTIGFVGTPGFAAPELYTSRAEFTTAVDVYAFGVTALFLGLRSLPPELRQRPPEVSITNYFATFPFKLDNEVETTLNSCLELDPGKRPNMADVRNVLAKHLLHDRHRALAIFRDSPCYLDATRRSIRLRLAKMGEVEIRYDGFCFRIHNVSGDVFLNNRRVIVNDILPGACVVSLGAPEEKSRRRYITFDVSHPEIVL